MHTATDTDVRLLREQEDRRRELAAIMRQHESAVFSYLYRRVRRSVDVGGLTQEVFARLIATGDLALDSGNLRPRLLEIGRQVLDEFVLQASDSDAAWTGLCLELDDLARQRRIG